MDPTLADRLRERGYGPAIGDEALSITIPQGTILKRIEGPARALLAEWLAPCNAVQPNSQELLLLCLALARARLSAAPLNSAYKLAGLRAYITDVDARALLPSNPVVSCFAPHVPAVLQQLERLIGAPLLEAYGLAKASQQIASNPLASRLRKPSMVGFRTGTTP